MAEPRHRFILTTLFVALTACCLTAGACVVWSEIWQIILFFSIAFVGGLLFSTLVGFLGGMLAIAALIAFDPPEPRITPVEAIVLCWAICFIPIAAVARLGNFVGRRLAPRPGS